MLKNWMRLLSPGYASSRVPAELLQVLRSEIQYEQSSPPPQFQKCDSMGDFTIDWDDPRSKDVILRRKYGWGEEIAVSAMLQPLVHRVEEESGTPTSFYKALMKVCIKKPGLSSVVQFDCHLSSANVAGDDSSSGFFILGAYYLHDPDPASLGASNYRGPLFRTLDPQLQSAFKEYLAARGVNEDLTDFLRSHLYRKENNQYLTWLSRLEAMFLKDA